jgi:molecular chaperone GrpE
MNKHNQHNPKQDHQVNSESPEPAASTPAEVPDESKGMDTALAEVDDLRQRLIRWQADYENLRRRSAREVLESRTLAIGDFAREMLEVLDHFESALSVDPAKTDTAGVLQGMKITYDELKKILAKRGIESFDPQGQPFDPNVQEAIAQEVNAQVPPMTVLQTLQRGYRIGERILRPAKVKVSAKPS